MRVIASGLALLLAATPALACVCSPPETEAQKIEIAARIARATAVVDIEQIAPMDYDRMRGETYRVVKVHLGSAPARFELARNFHRAPDGSVGMGMTSCDEVPPPGTRTTAVLHATGSPGKFGIGGTCDHLFVNTPGAIDLIRAQAIGRTERG